MHLRVDFVGGYAWLHQRVGQIESLSTQNTHFSHNINCLLILDFYFLLEPGFLLFLGNGGVVVVRFYNVFGDGSLLRDFTWSQRSSELETSILFGSLLFLRNVTQLVYSPIGFETVLRAEERRLEFHLLANGALHFSWLPAPRGPALACS